MSHIYNRELFIQAHGRYLTDAKTLTDEDLEQFAIVDPKLAERARAKRAGYVRQRTEAERKELKVPLTRGDLTVFIEDFVSPILATYHHKGQRIGIQDRGPGTPPRRAQCTDPRVGSGAVRTGAPC
jgi:hypothetical protein